MIKRNWLTTFGVAAIITSAALGTASRGQAQDRIYGIGGTGFTPTALSLFYFNSNSPGTITTVGTVSGVTAGYSLLGIDFRPATGELYGLGYDGSNNAQLFVLNLGSGAATARGASFMLGPVDGTSGTSIGIGFNPNNGMLRVVTGNGGNYVIDPTTGARTVATGLSYPASGDPNSGKTFQITDADYNGGTLYDVDYVNNTLATQSLNAGGLTTVGSLGVTLQNGATDVGFDISGSTAYLTGSPSTDNSNNPQERLYTVNLANGTATNVGLIGTNATFNTVDIAVFVVPEPGTLTLGVVGAGMLGTLALRRRRSIPVTAG